MSDLKERKSDGGLADLIEFYEMVGSEDDEDDAEMLVLLLELRRHRINSGELEAAQQRIAELEADRSVYVSHINTQANRADAAEAELARRDASAGEPFGYVHQCDHFFTMDSGTIYKTLGGNYTRPLFTAAQPSALPPEIVRNMDGFGVYQGRLIGGGAIGWYNQAIADAKALGCKAIKLPKVIPQTDAAKYGLESHDAYGLFQGSAETLHECKKMLRAQGFTVEGE